MSFGYAIDMFVGGVQRSNAVTVEVTPEQLREIANDLENNPDAVRTLETIDGELVDFTTPEEFWQNEEEN